MRTTRNLDFVMGELCASVSTAKKKLVEQNPGPVLEVENTVRLLCTGCGRNMKSGIQCDLCGRWCRYSCGRLKAQAAEREKLLQVFDYIVTISFRYILHCVCFNLLNPELNPICYLLALLGAYHFLHVSRIRVKLLTFRLLMSYIYGASIFYVSRSHTTKQHSR